MNIDISSSRLASSEAVADCTITALSVVGLNVNRMGATEVVDLANELLPMFGHPTVAAPKPARKALVSLFKANSTVVTYVALRAARERGIVVDDSPLPTIEGTSYTEAKQGLTMAKVVYKIDASTGTAANTLVALASAGVRLDFSHEDLFGLYCAGIDIEALSLSEVVDLMFERASGPKPFAPGSVTDAPPRRPRQHLADRLGRLARRVVRRAYAADAPPAPTLFGRVTRTVRRLVVAVVAVAVAPVYGAVVAVVRGVDHVVDATRAASFTGALASVASAVGWVIYSPVHGIVETVRTAWKALLVVRALTHRRVLRAIECVAAVVVLVPLAGITLAGCLALSPVFALAAGLRWLGRWLAERPEVLTFAGAIVLTVFLSIASYRTEQAFSDPNGMTDAELSQAFADSIATNRAPSAPDIPEAAFNWAQHAEEWYNHPEGFPPLN